MAMSDSLALDLDPQTRQALDLDELLDWVAGYARTFHGAEEIRGVVPTADGPALEVLARTVEELMRHLAGEGPVVPAGLPSAAGGLARLRHAGQPIPAQELRDLAAVVAAAGEIGQRLERMEAASHPRLHALGEGAPDLRRAVRVVLDAIAPDGSIADEATPELRRIRRHRAETTARLTRRLEGHLRAPGAGAVIRDDFITQRNGRFVIPVRSDSPHAVRGIVHATSSSGATQFVEPLETVELNNDLVRLAEAETREIERVLGEWSDALRARADAVLASIALLARVDALQARALFAAATGGRPAVLDRSATIRLVGFRHPLLERWLAQTGRRAVPFDLTLDPADRALVLSGPNAGGKTVTLKAIGLAALMAQCGVPLPALEAKLPLFRQVRADIGDHQSITADLSTFSAHVGAAARFLAERAPPSLFLFDEIGSGTDPAEGAALARAELEQLSGPGVTVVATTHQSSLKAWAHTAAGAVSAAMEFDTVELRPTYRVLADTAGLSAGLDIATRVGLPAAVVERARELLGPERTRAEDFLNRLQQQSRELARRTEELERRARELDDREIELERRRERAAELERQRLRAEFERVAQRLERESTEQLARLADPRERGRAARKLERIREQAATALARAIAPPATAGGPDEPIGADELAPGIEVWISSLGRAGVVDRVDGKHARVLVGALPTTVDRSELRRTRGGSGGAPRAGKQPEGGRRPARAEPDEESASAELMLIGRTVDEATAELDRFLDRAARAGLVEVRVVHGHGTGRLRRGVRQWLAGHPHVREYRPGRPTEGGDGATVVRLR
ncbi:MAG TPA: Smr/MutS family protein, partial [Candidatus Polarisedimenticolaceae bacterium]|nr:Smr/MutS family protein [Candidatus Polarisedimenticolaceae bacterium]